MASAQAVGGAALSSARVRELALAAGFSLCGFARAEPLPPEHLEGWLEAGLHADMGWMRERAADRLDPRRLLPNARTVVALACNYHWPAEAPSPLARYARGRDYHATLRDRLRRLRRTLTEQAPGLQTYGSVDSNPLMEKVWAAKAGLGYVGRNGCLITEPFGSWVVLAALVLDAEVDAYADGPAANRCGGCSACVSACPTSAIVADATVDAARCLSYQTIENEGEIPEPLRPAMAGTVFGCDACQEGCPLNADPVPADGRFEPRPVASLSPLELAAMSPEDYQRLVPGSALARAGHDGLRRNAAYALGAARAGGSGAVLEKLEGDSSEPLRQAARWARGRLLR